MKNFSERDTTLLENFLHLLLPWSHTPCREHAAGLGTANWLTWDKEGIRPSSASPALPKTGVAS